MQYSRSLLKRLVRRILLASGKKKLIPSEQYVGYTKRELLNHLGGTRNKDMHVDHVVPVTEFFRRGIFDPAIINALPNLRLVSALINRAKSDTVPMDAEDIIRACIAEAERRLAVVTKCSL